MYCDIVSALITVNKTCHLPLSNFDMEPQLLITPPDGQTLLHLLAKMCFSQDPMMNLHVFH